MVISHGWIAVRSTCASVGFRAVAQIGSQGPRWAGWDRRHRCSGVGQLRRSNLAFSPDQSDECGGTLNCSGACPAETICISSAGGVCANIAATCNAGQHVRSPSGGIDLTQQCDGGGCWNVHNVCGRNGRLRAGRKSVLATWRITCRGNQHERRSRISFRQEPP